MQYINKSSTFIRETLNNWDFLQPMTIFAIFLQFYMWFYKGRSVNISATTQKFVVALFYKINPVQITTIIAENTETSLNSVPHTIDSPI